jgi:GNAT superfamily N-acetyltransferase
VSHGVVLTGIVIAAVLLMAVAALIVSFARRQREVRLTASVTDHPAGTAADDGLERAGETASEQAVSAIRLRRRAAIPPIREAEPSDHDRLDEIEAHNDPGLTGTGLGALPGVGLHDGGAASVLLVAGRPAVAFARVEQVDGQAHLDRLAVLPVMARRGIGQALIDASIEWASGRGYRAMTLSTFTESDWNERVYDPTGFAPVQQLTPGLVELRDWERAIGLDAIGARIVKRRPLRG